MGFKCTLAAVSPGVPRDDIWSHDEGGADAAKAAAERFFPGKLAYASTGTVGEGLYPREPGDVWIGTWGDTTLVGFEDIEGALAFPGSTPDGVTVWRLMIHSVTDATSFHVHGPAYDRELDIWSEMAAEEYADAGFGRPLPFELPYLEGKHPEEDLPMGFHPLELGNAASIWIFGIEGETPDADEVMAPLISRAEKIDACGFPMHRFVPATPAAEDHRPFWKRLFG